METIVDLLITAASIYFVVVLVILFAIAVTVYAFNRWLYVDIDKTFDAMSGGKYFDSKNTQKENTSK